jgi:hypothetical protein
MQPPLFREEQWFSPWLFWPQAMGIPLFGFALFLFTGEPLALLVALVVGSLFIALFLLMRLITEVHEDGVYVRLFPMPFRRIAVADIASASPRTYRPIREYGGWGIRITWRHGRAYNARGNQGVQLVLKGGRRVLIGSQQPEDLAAAIAACQLAGVPAD